MVCKLDLNKSFFKNGANTFCFLVLLGKLTKEL